MFALLLAITFSSFAIGQIRCSEDFEGYELTVPSSTWRAESRPNATFTPTDFAYGPKDEVRLRIRKRLVGRMDTPDAAANHDLEMRRECLPGFY